MQSVDDFVRYLWNSTRIVKAALEYSLRLSFLGLVAPAAEGTQQRTNRGAPVIDPTIPRRPGYQIDDANRERGRASNAPRTPRPWAINYATARVGVRQVQPSSGWGEVQWG